MRIYVFLLILLGLPWALSAQHNPVSSFDPSEVRSGNGKYAISHYRQQELRESPVWQNFLNTHGTWYVHFNEVNGLPHRAFGQPIAVSPGEPEQMAAAFMEQQLAEFNIPFEELQALPVVNTGKHVWVNYRQYHNGLEVIGSRFSVKFFGNAVNQFICDVYDFSSFNATPTITSASAGDLAASGIVNEILSIETDQLLRILPARTLSSPEPDLVYSFVVKTKTQTGIPANYYTLVDAQSGEILYRSNQVAHVDANEHGNEDPEPQPPFYPGISPLPLELSVSVSGQYYVTNPWDAPVTGALPNVYLTVSGTNYPTDTDGSSLIMVNPGQTAQIGLKGPWARVYSNGVTPQANFVLQAGNNAISLNNSSNIKERTAYRSVQLIHDHVKEWMTSFTGMDFQLTTNVDVSGECNAFYDGSSINFYAIGGGCNATSLIPDVAFHEYGHGINDKFYESLGSAFMNGAMGEGYADFWALSLTNNPVLGSGFYTDNQDPIRRYDTDKKVYPVDISGEIHNDGEIIMGAWWDSHLLMGADWNVTMPLFVEAYSGLQAEALDGNEGQAYTDVLIDLLQADDTDGNISNGTPNGDAIVQGFYLHGITLLSNASLYHNDIEFANAESDITLSAFLNIQLPFQPYLQSVECHYKINDGDWNVLQMANTGGSAYSLDFPQQEAGTVIAYYVCTKDINNTISNVKPRAAEQSVYPNLPFFILVGAEQKAVQDCDDNEEWGQWQTGVFGDNATTGEWDLEIPIPSSTTDVAPGTIVQPGSQVTIGGEYCFVTGNASSPTAAVGENDVDDGRTTLQSPVIDMTEYTNPIIAYWRWYTNSPPSGANPGADWWQVMMSNNGGQSWVYIENNQTSDARWRRNVFRVADYLQPTSQMRFRFIASDSTHTGQNLDGGSLVEAAMDDFILYDQQEVSVKEVSLLTAGTLHIFPNPAEDKVRIDFTLAEAGNAQFYIVDQSGKMVYTSRWGMQAPGKNSKFETLPQLSNGTYTLEVFTEKEKVTGRLLIER